MDPFGGPVQLFSGDAADGTSPATAEDDMDRVRRELIAFNAGGAGSLRIYRPRPTAAFALRDTTLPQFGQAAEAMRGMGFVPVDRRTGGQLAVYNSSALVIDLVSPHTEPRLHVAERFRVFSAKIAEVLQDFSVDARVGGLAGEYCPGEYSVNAGGRMKLAGLAQRIGRFGYHLGAVISVEASAEAGEAVAEAYRILGFPFEPSTFGALTDFAEGITFTALRDALVMRLTQRFPPFRHQVPDQTAG